MLPVALMASVGGTSFRPSINAYQYGNALAIASIANLAGRSDIQGDL